MKPFPNAVDSRGVQTMFTAYDLLPEDITEDVLVKQKRKMKSSINLCTALLPCGQNVGSDEDIHEETLDPASSGHNLQNNLNGNEVQPIIEKLTVL